MSPYLLDLSHIDNDKLLALWSGVVPANATLMAVSCFGDLFLTAHDGTILWLDTLEGELVTVAATESEWRRLLASPEAIERWFWPGFVESVQERGVTLEPAQCLAWRIHPLVGGPLESANLAPMNIVAYHSVVSSLHNSPPGTKISHFTVDGEIP